MHPCTNLDLLVIGQNVFTTARFNISIDATKKNIKKMSSCQKDVKCQKIQHLDYGGGSQKKKIDTMRFTDIDVNFDVTNDGH